jgi:hypothetical protein
MPAPPGRQPMPVSFITAVQRESYGRFAVCRPPEEIARWELDFFPARRSAKARETRRVASLDPPEERCKRKVQPMQNRILALAINRLHAGIVGAQCRRASGRPLDCYLSRAKVVIVLNGLRSCLSACADRISGLPRTRMMFDRGTALN